MKLMRIRNTAGKAVKKRAAAAEKNVPPKPRVAHPEFLQEAVFLRRERQAGLRIRIHFIRIRIQHFRLNTNPDPIRIQGFNDQKLKNNYS
jgi:hypothetical protein